MEGDFDTTDIGSMVADAVAGVDSEQAQEPVAAADGNAGDRPTQPEKADAELAKAKPERTDLEAEAPEADNQKPAQDTPAKPDPQTPFILKVKAGKQEKTLDTSKPEDVAYLTRAVEIASGINDWNTKLSRQQRELEAQKAELSQYAEEVDRRYASGEARSNPNDPLGLMGEGDKDPRDARLEQIEQSLMAIKQAAIWEPRFRQEINATISALAAEKGLEFLADPAERNYLFKEAKLRNIPPSEFRQVALVRANELQGQEARWRAKWEAEQRAKFRPAETPKGSPSVVPIASRRDRGGSGVSGKQTDKRGDTNAPRKLDDIFQELRAG